MNARKIDVHHHAFPPAVMAAIDRLGIKKEAGGIAFPAWSVQAAIDNMDRHGIRASIASVSSPGVWFGDATLARDLARSTNEFLAGMVADNPTRFGAVAVLPQPRLGDAVAEAAYALDTLGLDGIGMYTSMDDRYLGDPHYDELMQELDRRKATVFVHPHLHSSTEKLGLGFPETLIEFPVDTSRAILNLVLTGTLERYPNIHWIFSHAGGAAPFLAWRWALADASPYYRERAPQGVLAYLKRLYYDTTLSPTSQAMRPLLEVAGPSQIVFGADFPYAPPAAFTAEVALIDRLDVFDASARQAMEEGNALRLFPRLAARLAARPQEAVSA